MDINSTKSQIHQDNVGVYQGLLHPSVLAAHASMTCMILFGGPATLVLSKLALEKVKLGLLFFEVGNMGLQLLVVLYHTLHSTSFMLR